MTLRYGRIFLLTLIALAMTSAQTPAPHKRRLLCIGETKGYQHDSVPYAMATLWELGKESGLWETYIRTDTQLITKKKLDKNAKNLDDFDAIYFFTTGTLDMDEDQKAALLSFVHDDGKGFIGGHSATDTFYDWREYGDMIGGYFDDHPWERRSAKINVEDRQFPATRHFPPSLTIYDEFYQLKNFSREKTHVLLSIDTSMMDMSNKRVHRTDFPVAWEHTYGKGRVFSCSLGHESAVYDRPDMRTMYVEAVKWAMGITK